VRRFKRVTGLSADTQKKLVDLTIHMLTAAGYQDIEPSLRDEIRQYFAEPNGRLKEILATSSGRTS